MSFRSISENLNAYREEAGSHPVALDRVLGFTFIRAWVYLMFVGAAASSMTWSGEQIPPLFYVVSTASLCAVLFGSALAGERFVRFMTHPAARFAAPALTTGWNPASRLVGGGHRSGPLLRHPGRHHNWHRLGADRSGLRRVVPQRAARPRHVRGAPGLLSGRRGVFPRHHAAVSCRLPRLLASSRHFRLDPVRRAACLVAPSTRPASCPSIST